MAAYGLRLANRGETYDVRPRERRRDLVKKAKAEAETGKIAIRNIRKDANEKIRRLKSEGVSEDEMKAGEHEVQKLTDSYIQKVDQLSEAKEKDIMTV